MKKKSGTNQKKPICRRLEQANKKPICRRLGQTKKSPYAKDWNKPNKQMANRELNIAQNTAQKYRETKKKWK